MHRTHGMIHPSTLTYIVIYARAGWKQSPFGPNLGVRASFFLSSNHSCVPQGRAWLEAQGHPDTASFPWSAALNCREYPWVWSQNTSVLKRKAEEQLKAIRTQQNTEEQRALCWKSSSAGGQHWKPLAELCEDLAEALTSCMTLSRLSASSLMRVMLGCIYMEDFLKSRWSEAPPAAAVMVLCYSSCLSKVIQKYGKIRGAKA